MKQLSIAIAGLLLSSSTLLSASPAQISKANNDFGFSLLRELHDEKRNQNENQFLSPFSIQTAFGMALSGASGATRTDMMQALKIPSALDSVQLNSDFQDLLAELKGEMAVQGYDLSVVNHFWAQEGFGFLPSYIATIEDYYAAGLQEYDFKNQFERLQAIDDINQWAKDHTNGRITDVVSEDTITKDTRFVLTNAIYFLAKWSHPFPRNPGADLPKLPFATYNGEKAESAFLIDQRYVPYFEDSNLQAIELNYKNKENYSSDYSMLIMLPKENSTVDALLSATNDQRLQEILNGLSGEETLVQIPAFEIKAEYMLAEVLKQKMNMKMPFSEYADFSAMTGKPNLNLSEVIHKTFIKVDNEGTEAAAVTAIIGMELATAINVDIPKVFKADRPFVYLIRHKATNTVLFAGT
jgi:serpin B